MLPLSEQRLDCHIHKQLIAWEPASLAIAGMLPLFELRLDSYIHKQQPTLSRSSYSHVDNEGVKALVDSICHRWCSIISGERLLSMRWCCSFMCVG